jgi:hypothetical protein
VRVAEEEPLLPSLTMAMVMAEAWPLKPTSAVERGKGMRLWQVTRIGTVARTQRRFVGTTYGGAVEMRGDGCRTQSSCFKER